MECLVQWLDEIEDLVYAVALKAERIRMAVQFFLLMFATISLQVTGVVVALMHPPAAIAIASLLSVGMLFRAVVNHTSGAYAN